MLFHNSRVKNVKPHTIQAPQHSTVLDTHWLWQKNASNSQHHVLDANITKDMAVLPWPVSVFKVTQVATQLDTSFSDWVILRVSGSREAWWLERPYKVKSLIILRAGVNLSTSHVSCLSILKQEKKKKVLIDLEHEWNV